MEAFELPAEPEELKEEQYWNMWVAIGEDGLAGACPNLSELLDQLEADGRSEDTTIQYNRPPDDTVVIF